MSTLSEYLNAHLPAGWQKTQLVEALNGRLDRATVYKYLAGNHPQNPQDSVLQAFAEVLPGATVVGLRAAANQPVGIEEPWIPPIEANRLTLAQRRALEAFIKATVASTEAAEPVSAGPIAVPAAPLEPVRGQGLSAEEQAEVRDYIDQLHSSGRRDLAERVAASLVIAPAAEPARRGARD